MHLGFSQFLVIMNSASINILFPLCFFFPVILEENFVVICENEVLKLFLKYFQVIKLIIMSESLV